MCRFFHKAQGKQDMSDEKWRDLEARLIEVEAQLAIIHLEAEYARSWDAGDASAWAALFTGDGVFDMAAVGAMERQLFTGQEQLRSFCRNVDAHYKGLHFMHLPRIRVDGDTAYGRLHFQWLGLFSPNASYHGQRQAAGYYDVTYRRVDGRWLMAHRLEKAISNQMLESFDVYSDADFGPQTSAVRL